MNACGHAYQCAHATDETLNDQRMTPIAFQRSGIKAFLHYEREISTNTLCISLTDYHDDHLTLVVLRYDKAKLTMQYKQFKHIVSSIDKYIPCSIKTK